MRLGSRWLFTAALLSPALPATASPAVHGDWHDVRRSAVKTWHGQTLTTAAADRLLEMALALVRPGVFVTHEDATTGVGEAELFARNHPLAEMPAQWPADFRAALFVDAFTGTPVDVVSGKWRSRAPPSFDGTLLWLLDRSSPADGRPKSARGSESISLVPLFSLPAAPLEASFRAAVRHIGRGEDDAARSGGSAPGGIAVHNPEPGSLALWALLAIAGGHAWRRRLRRTG